MLVAGLVAFAAVVVYRVSTAISAPKVLLGITASTAAMSGRRPTVVIVGGGLAGLSAAISALQSGARSVVLLERSAKPGGNSIKASSGINGAPTRYQKGGEPDRDFFSDTVRSAGKRFSSSESGQENRRTLIGVLTNGSSAAVDFLADEFGVDLSVVSQLGGHSVSRTHRGAGRTPPGAAIVAALLAKLAGEPNFQLRTNSEVTKLLTSHGRVTGVEYRSARDRAPAVLVGSVIFATGGFAGDAQGSLAQYRPDLAGLPSTNDPLPGMHGILSDVGATLTDMDSVQIHPTGFVDRTTPTAAVKILAAELLRSEGGILLHRGRRFVNELETRDVISAAIMALPPRGDHGEGGPRQWDITLLLDPGACEAAAHHVGFYVGKGLLRRVKVRELDAPTRATIAEFAAVAHGDEADKFGRTVFGHWRLKTAWEDSELEVCVGMVTPVVHFTMGGVLINERSQVVGFSPEEQRSKPLTGLWAAGEVTGGIHGDNRLGGSSLLECVVFGFIAGEQATRFAEASQS